MSTATITVTIEVPLSDIDLSQCYISRENEPSEAWGAVANNWVYDCDIDDATYNGLPCEIHESDREVVQEELMRERFANG